jgi:hypothetical protein
MRLRILEPLLHPRFDDLPWQLPLEEWSHPRLVDLPAGLHRHVVRFVDYDDQIYALKELAAPLARREFRLLRELNLAVLPVVRVVGLVEGREGLDAVLITRFLNYALPYRYLFRETDGPAPTEDLVNSLAGLLARLHLVGFYWGDCSLSNALFRRDARRLTAYALDTETGERQPTLTDGRRRQDLEIAIENVAGGLLDLAAAGEMPDSVDPFEVVERLERAYLLLWDELHDSQEYDPVTPDAVDARLARLQQLGFRVTEATIETGPNGRYVFSPVVVAEGHHRRELQRLTGIVAQEYQARRLLEDVNAHRAELSRERGGEVPEDIAAHSWVDDVFDPVLEVIPVDLLRKVQPPQAYHEVLEHRSALAAARGAPVDRIEAARDYVANVLHQRPDEKVIVPDDK